jgi:hypothetical protein
VRARREGGEEGSVAREREGERSIGPVEEEVEEEGFGFLPVEEEEEGALRFWFLVSCFLLALPLPLALLLLLLLLAFFLPWWAWAVVVIFFVFFALPATALPPLFLALGMAPSNNWCVGTFIPSFVCAFGVLCCACMCVCMEGQGEGIMRRRGACGKEENAFFRSFGCWLD